MQILFVRHGESTDDLSDSFGGWADFALTEKGVQQAREAAERIAELGNSFQYVYTSNLKRAVVTAQTIAEKLNLPYEENVYLKERNTYGLLTGLNKAEAKSKYPELFSAYEAGQVMGDETLAELKERVLLAIKILSHTQFERVIAVTHSKYLNSLITEVLGKKLEKAHDGGFMLLEFTEAGKAKLLKADGIDIV
jgi:broad specificity phosphatase PhoE